MNFDKFYMKILPFRHKTQDCNHPFVIFYILSPLQFFLKRKKSGGVESLADPGSQIL